MSMTLQMVNRHGDLSIKPMYYHFLTVLKQVNVIPVYILGDLKMLRIMSFS